MDLADGEALHGRAEPAQGQHIGDGGQDDGLWQQGGILAGEADGGVDCLGSLQARRQILTDHHVEARHLCHAKEHICSVCGSQVVEMKTMTSSVIWGFMIVGVFAIIVLIVAFGTKAGRESMQEEARFREQQRKAARRRNGGLPWWW